MSNWKTTIMSVAVHRNGTPACFDDSVTKIELFDEAGGAFLHLSQCNDRGEGSIYLDLDELELILVEARNLIAQYDND